MLIFWHVIKADSLDSVEEDDVGVWRGEEEEEEGEEEEKEWQGDYVPSKQQHNKWLKENTQGLSYK